MWTHRPWFIGIAKVILTDIAILGAHYWFFSAVFAFYPLQALCAVLYLQIFKCLWHWGPMHWYPSQKEWFKKYLENSKFLTNSFFTSVHKSHISHHTNFGKKHFQSHDPEKLNDIVSDVHIFPILLTGHYLLMLIFIPWQYIPTIILSMSIWFAAFEATHWFTHVENNAVDKTLRRIPVLGYFWAHMFEYHRFHHEEDSHSAFNFLFPYLGDRLFGTYIPPKIVWDKSLKQYRAN